MHSCLYEGLVTHQRFVPVRHGFRYRVFMVYLDLGELDRVFASRWLWSARLPAPAWFRRADHLGDASIPLDAAVRDLVERDTGRRPGGPITLLTHLRYFGYVMNPVSFYYCWDPDRAHVETIVAEIHNTPWGERYCYTLDARASLDASPRHRHRFDKTFHVSPFMAMEQGYDWRFVDPGPRLTAHMENFEKGRRMLSATLRLQRTPMTARSMARVLASHPPMTFKVVGAIYWQAFRLWHKGVPFHPHPKHRLEGEHAQ